ncbi:rna-directed dna polymerase from mobile element jockey-like [Pitangus sulphuratus]|nr:rna-directed dna polymerase from mobile element jockey-like [Pitangus sulphuratus]
MVFKRAKAIAAAIRGTVLTQTELPMKDAAVQVTGCTVSEPGVSTRGQCERHLRYDANRPPNQDDEGDELFYKQLADVSKSPALVLVCDFNLPDVCWELNTAEKRQSRRFLECIEDNFLLQLVNELTKGGAPLDLLFTNSEGLMGDVVVRGHLGYSDHAMIEFSILRDAERAINKTSALDFWRANFSLLRRLVQREEFRNIVRSCRKKIRETEAQFELYLATSVRDNKKCFYQYINSKKRGKENLHSLLDMEGETVIKDEEKDEVLNTFLASVFNTKTGCPQDKWPLEMVDRDRKPNSTSVIQEETVSDLLSHLDPHKSMGPNGIHPRGMRVLAEELSKPSFTNSPGFLGRFQMIGMSCQSTKSTARMTWETTDLSA